MSKNLKKLRRLFHLNKDIKDNMKKYIIIDNNDNVMVALEDFVKGDVVNNITILEDVKKGELQLIDVVKLYAYFSYFSRKALINYDIKILKVNGPLSSLNNEELKLKVKEYYESLAKNLVNKFFIFN